MMILLLLFLQKQSLAKVVSRVRDSSAYVYVRRDAPVRKCGRGREDECVCVQY
jgi:hypothetical protein